MQAGRDEELREAVFDVVWGARQAGASPFLLAPARPGHVDRSTERPRNTGGLNVKSLRFAVGIAAVGIAAAASLLAPPAHAQDVAGVGTFKEALSMESVGGLAI